GQCGDLEDDDGDGAVDCHDSDCAGDAACAPRACAHKELGSALPLSYTGGTSQEYLRFSSSCDSSYAAGLVHLYTPPETGEYSIQVRGLGRAEDLQPTLQVLASCAGDELACQRPQGMTASLRVSLEAGKPVLLVVRGQEKHSGSYTLTVTRSTGNEGCVPQTCHTLMATCGEYPDGCGGTLQCGSCAEGEVCGAILPRTCGICAVGGDLGNTLPVRREGTPSHGWAGSQYGSDVRDIYRWTAPRAGTYVIGNAGSGPESWMKVGLDACAWTPAPGPTPEHPNRYHLEAGQSVYVSLFGDGERLGWLRSFFHLSIAEAAASEQGLCADRIDNDGDGKLDCWDAECGGTPECQVDACTDVKLGGALPLHARLPKGLGHDLFKPDCGPEGRDERVVSWTAPAPGTYVFHAIGPAYGISLRSGCLGEQLACDVGYEILGPDSYTPAVVREVGAGETLLIILQGSKGNDDLPFGIPEQLFIHPWVPSEGEGLCEDGRDNDGDGLIDARDPGCPNYSEW
ncbi:MAG TPA: hypothetical protein VGB96_00270, partial [Archangium sp.]